ncbi:MAG: hypothetical protein HUJ69_07085 [Lachnospiraceae bacterium]|nr:hypothetical protein [Lachnospiraceae bacterium]
MTRKQIQMQVLLQNTILAFVINSAATVLGGGFVTPGMYLVGMFMAFSINYVAAIIIPVDPIGRKVAGALGLKDGQFLFKLVRIFIVNAIFVTIISFTIALIMNGPVDNLISIWWSTYPVLHLVGFITSVLIENGCADLAQTVVK